MTCRTLTALAAVALSFCPAISLDGHPQASSGAVYTMTNAADGNEVVVYNRFGDGSLLYSNTYPTGGMGSGGGLGNQGGVVLSDNGKWLLVVNAGSDEVSAFRVKRRGLQLTDTVLSGGVRPISVTIHGDMVYVLHAGGNVGDADGISGLWLDNHGRLTPVPDSFRPLSAPDTGPAQIGFTPDGRFLVVTEKATSSIDVFALDPEVYPDGQTGPVVVNPSAGQTPFAFGFGKRSLLVVSEVFGGAEDAGAVSSYEMGPLGSLTVIDASVPNTETAPCWLVVTRGGRYAFTTNTPDDSLSAYAVDFDGHLQLLDEDGRTGEPGMGTRPLDMDLSDNGRFLYTLNIGDDTIGTFGVMPDGSLEYLGAVGGVPDGANGLAAR